MTAYVLIVDLSSDKPQVLRRFEQHRIQDALLSLRVIRGRSKSVPSGDVEMADVASSANANANAEPSASPTGGMDVDQDAEPTKSTEDADVPASDSESEDADPTPLPTKPVPATITRLAISADGQWLATTDDRRRTHVFNLDSVQHHCVLPSFSHAAHALAFASSSPSSVLVLGLADNSIHAYDVESRTFPVWARDLASSVPHRFKHLHDPILGVVFDVSAGTSSDVTGALFWGATWLCRVHLDRGMDGYGGFDKRKRRWGGRSLNVVAKPLKSALATGMNAVALGTGKEEGEADNFKVVTTYRPILFVDFIGPKELVVVERPLVDVLAKLPPAFFKPKYGAT